MAHNMQAMQSLLNSLSDEKQQELQRLMQQVFGDEPLQQAIADLMQHLQDYMQQKGLGERLPFQGNAELPLQRRCASSNAYPGHGATGVRSNGCCGGDPQQIDDEQVRQRWGRKPMVRCTP